MEQIDKLFIATKAFIVNNGKVLVLRESTQYSDGSNAGRFDVPGGRLKPGEHFEEALKREVKEETGLEVTIGKPVYVGEWRPTVKGEHWQIVGVFFLCESAATDVTLSEDHVEALWIHPGEASTINIIDNLKQAFEALQKAL